MPLPPTRYINAGPMPAQANPASAMAAGRATEGLGKAVSGVAEQQFSVLEKVRQVKEAGAMNAFMANLDEEAGRFAIELAQRHDTDNWPGDWKERVDDMRERAKGLGLSPEAMAKLDNQFTSWSSQRAISFETQAATKALGMARMQSNTALEHAMARNDEEAVRRVLDSGIYNPAEEDKILMELQRRSAVFDYERRIDADPLQAERDLRSPEFLEGNPALTAQDAENLARRAEQRANRFRDDFANDIIISGEIPSEEDLAEMEKKGLISKITHAQWLLKLRGASEGAADPAPDSALYNEIFSRIVQYDPQDDENLKLKADLRHLISGVDLPAEHKKALNEKLEKRISEAGQPMSEYESRYSKKIEADFRRGDFGNYRYPFDHDNNPATAPIIRTNPEEYEKAWRLSGEFSDAWRGIFAGLPADADAKVVGAAYDELKKSFLERTPPPDIDFGGPEVDLPFNPDEVYQNLLPSDEGGMDPGAPGVLPPLPSPSGGNPSFGGVPLMPAGIPYKGAVGTVFGGSRDPNDNGTSAYGGPTGTDGREGAAIPQAVLAELFPRKPGESDDERKRYEVENLRVVVRNRNGVYHTLPLADRGTAEEVWRRNGRATLDLTEGAVRRVGGLAHPEIVGANHGEERAHLRPRARAYAWPATARALRSRNGSGTSASGRTSDHDAPARLW
jgi:hypothetical protein